MNALNALARTALHHLCSAGLRHSARAFERAAQDPERAQHERLQRFLADNAGSVYGLQYGYHSIRTVEEFQRRVPVVDHAHLAPPTLGFQKGQRTAPPAIGRLVQANK